MDHVDHSLLSQLSVLANSVPGFEGRIFSMVLIVIALTNLGGQWCLGEIRAILLLLNPFESQKVIQKSEVLLELSWEKLHTGYWKDVDICWRDLFSFSSLLLAIAARMLTNFLVLTN